MTGSETTEPWWGPDPASQLSRSALPELPPHHYLPASGPEVSLGNQDSASFAEGPVQAVAISENELSKGLVVEGPVEDVTTEETTSDVGQNEWIPGGYQSVGSRVRKPWGLGDAFLGLTLGLLLSLVGSLIATAVVLVTRGDFKAASTLDPGVFTHRVTLALESGPSLFMSLVGLWAGFLLGATLATRRKGSRSLANDFGLRFNWPRDILIGLGAAAFLRLLEFVVTQALTGLKVDISGSDNVSPVTSQHGVWLVLLIIGASVGAPFFEELYFRGLLLRSLLRRFAGPVTAPVPATGLKAGFKHVGNTALRVSQGRRAPVFASILLSSAIFGAMHSQGHGASLAYIAISTGLVGSVLALMAVKTGRLGPGICTHVAFNTSGVLLALIVR